MSTIYWKYHYDYQDHTEKQKRISNIYCREYSDLPGYTEQLG